MAKAKDNKVFDVAKPGKSAPSATSRPIIVGHKPSVKDSTVVTSKGKGKKPASGTPEPESDALATAPVVPDMPDLSKITLSSERKKIVPISEGTGTEPPAGDTTPGPEAPSAAAAEKPDDSQDSSPAATDADTEPETKTKPTEDTAPDKAAAAADTANGTGQTAEGTPEESTGSKATNDETGAASSDSAEVAALAGQAKTKQALDKQNEAEAAKRQTLEKLIDEKKYFVPIGESRRRRRSSRIANVLLLFLLLAAVGVYAAIDAGYLDVGLDMPFDFIKN